MESGINPAPDNHSPEYRTDPPVSLLTPRQQQVALRIAHGKTNREIGQDLQLSVFTVRNEVIGIMRKLKARNRSHIAFMIGQSKLGNRLVS